MTQKQGGSIDKPLLEVFAHELKRRSFFVIAVSYFTKILFYTLASSIVFSLLIQLSIIPGTLSPIFFLFIILPAFFAAAIGFSRTKTPRQALIDADKAYNLHELLISGYELSKREQKSALSNTVIERASEAVHKLNSKNVYPLTRNRKMMFIPIFLILSFTLLAFNFTSDIEPEKKEIYELTALIEELGDELAVRSEETGDTQTRDLAERLKQLAEEMKQMDGIGEPERRKLERIANDIERQLGGIQRTEGFDQEQQAQTESGEQPDLERLRRQLGDETLNEMRKIFRESGEIPAEQLEDAKESFGEFARDDSGNFDPEKAEDIMEQLLEQESRQKKQEALEKAAETVDDLLNTGSEKITEESSDSAGETGPAEGEREDRSTGNTESTQTGKEEGDPSGNFQGTPGTNAAEDEMDNSEDIDSKESSLTELEGESRRENLRRLLVRSEQPDSESRVSDDEIINEYAKTIEEAITVEPIPLSMKEIVRDYFITIGLIAEAERSEVETSNE